MKIFSIILTFALGIFFFTACSKQAEKPATKYNSEKITTSQPVPTVAPESVQKSEDQAAIAQAAEQLKDPNLTQQIKGVRELRQTYSPEACKILVVHLQEKEAELPASLDQKESIQLRYLVDYLGALIEEIRSMNQVEGNEAVEIFMKNFRAKYGHEKLGQAQLATYESQLNSVERGIAQGLYKKRDKKKTEEFLQMIGGSASKP